MKQAYRMLAFSIAVLVVVQAAVMVWAIAGLGVVMSIGPRLPLYTWLYDVVPLLQATRVTSRWGGLALSALLISALPGPLRWTARRHDIRKRTVGSPGSEV